ncbi:MAG: HVO_2901 family zinc finger protein [Halobacteriota archaeon]
MAHLETHGRDLLRCRSCGAVFPEGQATRDGWYYECPEDGCTASGIGDGLRRIE